MMVNVRGIIPKWPNYSGLIQVSEIVYLILFFTDLCWRLESFFQEAQVHLIPGFFVGGRMGLWWDAIPSGYVKIAIENCHLWWIFPLKLVICHSYVELTKVLHTITRITSTIMLWVHNLGCWWGIEAVRTSKNDQTRKYSGVSEDIIQRLNGIYSQPWWNWDSTSPRWICEVNNRCVAANGGKVGFYEPGTFC